MPPSYWNSTRLPPERSSVSEILRPRVRNAVSRRRCSRIEKSKSRLSKISASGRKLMVVPVSSARLALAQVVLRRAALVLLGPGVAVAADLDVQRLAERIDDRQADAVQAAGHLVAAVVAELAAGVQDGEHHLDGRAALLLHVGDGDAAPVVDDGDGAVGVDRDVDARAVAGQRLVDRVVDDLVDEVVQAAQARRADVHARALAHGLEALEDGDVLGVVSGRSLSAVLGVLSPAPTCLRRRAEPRSRANRHPAGARATG